MDHLNFCLYITEKNDVLLVRVNKNLHVGRRTIPVTPNSTKLEQQVVNLALRQYNTETVGCWIRGKT